MAGWIWTPNLEFEICALDRQTNVLDQDNLRKWHPFRITLEELSPPFGKSFAKLFQPHQIVFQHFQRHTRKSYFLSKYHKLQPVGFAKNGIYTVIICFVQMRLM